MRLTIHPLTADRWNDFAKLFGPRGACANCWCMWWRLDVAAWRHGKAGGNRNAMEHLVRRGGEPGLLAYDGDVPVGWCALAPRMEYPRLARSRILAPVDNQVVWSVTCFFVARTHRRRGITTDLLKAAAEFARRRKGRILEGYPVEVASHTADTFLYHGTASAFRRTGFQEVTRRSATRPILRLKLSETVAERTKR